jgi:hypothetical protein
MRSINLSRDDGFDEDRALAFSVDGLCLGKFAHVKQFTVDDTIEWDKNSESIAMICKAVVNVESLAFLGGYLEKDSSASLPLFRSLCLYLNPREFEFQDTLELSYAASGNFSFPKTLRKVILTVNDECREWCRCLFRDLDSLSLLDHLELHYQWGQFDTHDEGYLELLDYPGLLGCLKRLSGFLFWPRDKELLSRLQAIEWLQMGIHNSPEFIESGGSAFWETLAALRNLTELTLDRCPTAAIVGLSSVP